MPLRLAGPYQHLLRQCEQLRMAESGVRGRCASFCIAISKFGDALGVELEPVFQGLDPILHVEH